MGTDRNELLNVPCPCGKGRIAVTFCSPDHAYAKDKQTRREDNIDCGDCNAKYKIIENEKDLVLVAREDHERWQADQKRKELELKDLEQRVWEGLEKSGDLDAVASHLKTFKTATAAFAWLSDCYVFRDFGDFRRKFTKHNCTRDWVKKHFYPRALEKVFEHMQKPNQSLQRFFIEHASLSKSVVPTPKPIKLLLHQTP